MKKTISGISIECVKGDITSQADIATIVNAANAFLHKGGGVTGAIYRAAGAELEKACRPLAPIKPGQAVITPGFDLPNSYIIHCLGPVYGSDHPEAELLASCYLNALKRAEEVQIASVAFPSISTGVFGYPVNEAAIVAIEAIANIAPSLKFTRLIRFVLFSHQDYEVYVRALDNCEK